VRDEHATTLPQLMSVFTNPASASVEQARAYVEAILGLLGDRDPLEVLRTTPAEVRAAVDGHAPDRLRRAEAPGKWSIAQVVQHLADSDLVWGFRLRMVLAHDRPRLAGYDQDLWAERLGYAAAEPGHALEVFTTLRRANLRLLEAATPADLRRIGVHEERGEESVEHMVRLYAGHDLSHRRQLTRIRMAIEGSA
jgi:uncharacterized damage-inducible protein DinB